MNGFGRAEAEAIQSCLPHAVQGSAPEHEPRKTNAHLRVTASGTEKGVITKGVFSLEESLESLESLKSLNSLESLENGRILL